MLVLRSYVLIGKLKKMFAPQTQGEYLSLPLELLHMSWMEVVALSG
jgi:hypothetical protein